MRFSKAKRYAGVRTSRRTATGTMERGRFVYTWQGRPNSVCDYTEIVEWSGTAAELEALRPTEPHWCASCRVVRESLEAIIGRGEFPVSCS